MITIRRLSYVKLTDPVEDPIERWVIPMVTLIGVDAEPPNHQWLLETSWDGRYIGDVQIFKNEAIGHNGVRVSDVDNWVWWQGVPCARVKSYRFAKGLDIKPQTVDGQREEKPRQADKGSQQPRA